MKLHRSKHFHRRNLREPSFAALIKVVRSNAFYHIPSVSRLDLSGNKISRIEIDAFREIGKSLLYLKMSHALHTHDLPNLPFQSLTAITTLDLSDNFIRSRAVTQPSRSFAVQCFYANLPLVGKEKEKALVGAFSGHCKTLRRIVDSLYQDGAPGHLPQDDQAGEAPPPGQ